MKDQPDPRNSKSSIGVSLAIALLATLGPCQETHARLKTSSEVPMDVVSRAEVVVIATPIGYEHPPGKGRRGKKVPSSRVIFRVDEQLKGWCLPGAIVLHGYLLDRDAPVQQGIVRSVGGKGGCSFEYRRGEQYLLFLRPTVALPGKIAAGQSTALTPYWCALGPVNEQLRGTRDPWLLRVKKRLRASGGIRETGASTPISPGPSPLPWIRSLR